MDLRPVVRSNTQYCILYMYIRRRRVPRVYIYIYFYFFVSTAQQVRGVSAVNGSGFRGRRRERYGEIYTYIIYTYTIIIIITGTYGMESALWDISSDDIIYTGDGNKHFHYPTWWTPSPPPNHIREHTHTQTHPAVDGTRFRRITIYFFFVTTQSFFLMHSASPPGLHPKTPSVVARDGFASWKLRKKSQKHKQFFLPVFS